MSRGRDGLRRYHLKAPEELVGERLDRVLMRWLSDALGRPVSRKQAKQLLDTGAVSLNGRRVRIASKRLHPRARLEARLDPDGFARPLPEDPLWELSPERILFEDDDLIVVDKPSGLATQATVVDAHQHLFAAVRRFVARRHGDRAYVGLHHRLDRQTSGVVLMTRSRRANKGIAESFRERRVEKRYHALCLSTPTPPPDPWEVEGPLRRPGPEGRKDDGRWASSTCRVLEVRPDRLHIEVRPHTGRRHQVRLHLAMSGMPILGDRRYGGAPASRMMLHAHALRCHHPVTGAALEVTSPLPSDFLQALAGGGGGASC